MKDSVKEPNKFHNYETEKITPKASDAAEYIELFGSYARDRHARRILCYSLNVRRYMHHRAWWTWVKEPNNLIYSVASLALRVIFVRRKRPQIYASGMAILGERTEQHVVIGFGESSQLEYVDIRLVY